MISDMDLNPEGSLMVSLDWAGMCLFSNVEDDRLLKDIALGVGGGNYHSSIGKDKTFLPLKRPNITVQVESYRRTNNVHQISLE